VDATECAAAWSMAVDALLERPDAFALIDAAHRQHAHAGLIVTHRKGLKCADEHWESCCSSLQTSTCKDTERRECCHMGNGTRAHLRLPALREIAIDVRLPTGRLIRIEQDGLLRPFDLPTVLWPAGYLLSLWAADPEQRALWAMTGRQATAARPSVLDLGTGTGAAAVAAAIGGGGEGEVRVLATDVAARALALATANAALAGTRDVEVRSLDWEDDAAVDETVRQYGPFHLVMGVRHFLSSNLQRALPLFPSSILSSFLSLRAVPIIRRSRPILGRGSHVHRHRWRQAALQFEKWERRLWSVLERLTVAADERTQACDDDAEEATNGSLVALVHTVGGIGSPPAWTPFIEIARLPGAARYGMFTRWNEHESDFEVVLLRRRERGNQG